MACNSYVLKGIARGCRDSIGGLKRVYVSANYDEVIAGVSVADNVLDVDSSVISKFKPFAFHKNTASITSNLQTSDNAGNSFSTELAMTFLKQETAKRLELMALFMAETVVVAEDANGKMWLLGLDNPVTATAGTGVTGAVSTDLNGYTITLTDESKELPYEITDADTIAAFKALVVA